MLPNRRRIPPKPTGRGVSPSPGTPAAPDQAAAPPVVHRKATPPPPIVAYEDVIAACGHPEKFGLFEDHKDKFRKDRRKKVTDRPCKACRERKRLEEEEAIKMKRAEKQQRAAEAAKAVRPEKEKPAGDHAVRLPDGSKFEVVYDATQAKWTGTLTVEDRVFSDSAGGVFKLLTRLDRQYRQTLPPASPQNAD